MTGLSQEALSIAAQLLPREETIKLLPTEAIVDALKKELSAGRYKDPAKINNVLDVLASTFPQDGIAFRAMLRSDIWPKFQHVEVMRRILWGWSLQRRKSSSGFSVDEGKRLTYADVVQIAGDGFLVVGPDADECYTFFVHALAPMHYGPDLPFLVVLRDQCLQNLGCGATPADLLSWIEKGNRRIGATEASN